MHKLVTSVGTLLLALTLIVGGAGAVADASFAQDDNMTDDGMVDDNMSDDGMSDDNMSDTMTEDEMVGDDMNDGSGGLLSPTMAVGVALVALIGVALIVARVRS